MERKVERILETEMKYLQCCFQYQNYKNLLTVNKVHREFVGQEEDEQETLSLVQRNYKLLHLKH